jgi:hypothetical protein
MTYLVLEVFIYSANMQTSIRNHHIHNKLLYMIRGDDGFDGHK